MRQSGKKAPLPIAASITFRESNQLCLSADAVSASLESKGPRAWQSILPDPMVAGKSGKMRGSAGIRIARYREASEAGR